MSSSRIDEQDSSSEIQSLLQGVLVTLKIKDPDKTTQEKRVRFNSLVEVRFIPKVKAKKAKIKEEKMLYEEQENTAIKGNENVANGNAAVSQEEPREEWNNESTKTDSTPDKKKPKEKTNMKPNCPENKDDGESNGNQVVVREGFFLPKVIIGQEYEGDGTRTVKVTPKSQPKNPVGRMLKRSVKESRIHELNAKAVVHLERQATEFCREADRLFEDALPPGRIEWSPLLLKENVTYRYSPPESRKHQEVPQQLLHRSKSNPDFRRPSLPEMIKLELEGSAENTKKLSTSLPYVNMIPSLTGKTQDTNKKNSYTKLYLPQLQRKAEEIKRLNETVLRKKPKYSPDKSPSSPSDSSSPLGFNGERNCDKNESPPASSHSIVRYSHGLDIARLLNSTNPGYIFY